MSELVINLAMGIPGFLLAIVCHEAAHAYVAYKFGDQTAKASGRLTLNPSVHIDVLGTVIVPLVGALMGGYMFGWAKPVPVNASNFRKVRAGIFWVSFAGPAANVLLAIVSAFCLALLQTKVSHDFFLFQSFLLIFKSSLIVNLILAAFNVIPLPPLDGSKMVSAFLNPRQLQAYESLGAYSFFIILGLIILDSSSSTFKPFSMYFGPVMDFANMLYSFFIALLI